MLVETAAFLKPSSKRSLQHHGVVTFGDLLDVPPIELAAICRVSLDDAVALREQAKNAARPPQPCEPSPTQNSLAASSSMCCNVADLLSDESDLDSRRIATFSRSLDTMLGGGIPCGQLVEVCGAPGTGKTQFCMQLAVAVQLPIAFGGLDGEALYIDCEGSLVPGRLREIAAAACAQVQQIAHNQFYSVAASSDESIAIMRRAVADFTVERVLQGTHYLRILDLVEFVSVLLSLPTILSQEPYRNVRLVLIDSMAFHFRFGDAVADFAQRSRMLFSLGSSLQNQVASDRRIAVIVTNHVTQRYLDGGNDQRTTELVPALGDAWSHAVSTRLVIRHPGGAHQATILEDGVSQLRHIALLKDSTRPRGECMIRLCPKGIRNSRPPTLQSISEGQKRQRDE